MNIITIPVPGLKGAKAIVEAEARAIDPETIEAKGILKHLPPPLTLLFAKYQGASGSVKIPRLAVADLLRRMLEQVEGPLEPGQELTLDFSAFMGGLDE